MKDMFYYLSSKKLLYTICNVVKTINFAMLRDSCFHNTSFVGDKI